MPRTERRALIEQIEQRRQSRVICYLTSDRTNLVVRFEKDVMPIFYDHLRSGGDPARLDVLLFTLGGDTLAAFGLSRLLREFCNSVSVLVPEKCYSAGTLFALGANRIFMTRGATLSPIDPSVTTALNPVVELGPGRRELVPLSVESVAGFKALVTEEWGLQGEEVRAIAWRSLAERVHPLALGDVFRARQQIELLATKLLRAHRDDDKRIETIVSTLTKQLGSHDYLISRKEARELFGDQVIGDDAELEALIWALYRDFAGEMSLGVPYDPAQVLHANASAAAGPVRDVQRLAIVESLTASDVCEREVELSYAQLQLPGMPAMLPGGMPFAMQRTPREEPVRVGWVHNA